MDIEFSTILSFLAVSTLLVHTPISTLVVNTSVCTLVVNMSVLESLVDTQVLDSISIPVSIPLAGTIQIFIASPIVSTIVSIPDSKALTSRTVEPKVQPSTRLLISGKEIEEDVDLDE